MARCLCGVTLWGCLLCGVTSAQTQATFRSNSDMVTVSCAVLDELGKPVRGLSASEFRVTDNGRRRIIGDLWLDTESPLTLGVIIDSSTSQESRIEEHRQTALGVLERILRPGDRAFVMSIAGEARMWSDSTGSFEEIRSRLAEKRTCADNPRFGCGATPLWDAIFQAARNLLSPAKGSKALLLLTDGFDTGSLHTWQQAAEAVHKADASVYAIQYRSDLGGVFPKNLYNLLFDTGGASFFGPVPDCGSVASRLQTDLRERYVLSFRPDKLSAAVRHEVDVQLTRTELTVRGRKIYIWAPE
jgi:Ca-activated chloride channel homolog